MLEDYPKKFHSKLKNRARKGIPDSFRGIAWKKLANIDKIKKEHIGVTYKDLVKSEGKDKGTGLQLTFRCRIDYERYFKDFSKTLFLSH